VYNCASEVSVTVPSELEVSERWALAGGIREDLAAGGDLPLWEEDRCEFDVRGLDEEFETILEEAWDRVRVVEVEERGWRK
jgi:hypothetical protein